MESYADLKAQRLAELKAEPGYESARQRYGFIGGGVAAVIALGVAAFGAFGLAPIVLAPLMGAGAGFLIGRWIKAFRTSSEAASWATSQFMQNWAMARSLEVVDPAPVYLDVPMLRQGEVNRHETGAGFHGELLEGVQGTVYNFTYYTRETRTVTDSKGNTRTETYYEPHPHTVLRLELDLPFAALGMHGRSLGMRLFDGMETKLTSKRVVELESTEFNKAWKLTVADGDDDVAVRQLFDPTLIVAFLDTGKGFPDLESAPGAVVFMRPGCFACDDSDGLDELDALLDQVRPIVERLVFNTRGLRVA